MHEQAATVDTMSFARTYSSEAKEAGLLRETGEMDTIREAKLKHVDEEKKTVKSKDEKFFFNSNAYERKITYSGEI